MPEKRLGELSEADLAGMIDCMLGEAIDQVPAPEFFGTLEAMDEADAPGHVVVRGHVEGDTFVPHAVEGGALDGTRVLISRKSVIEIRVEVA
jgi:hypothetical protein